MKRRSKPDAELVAYTRKLLDKVNALLAENAKLRRKIGTQPVTTSEVSMPNGQPQFPGTSVTKELMQHSAAKGRKRGAA